MHCLVVNHAWGLSCFYLFVAWCGRGVVLWCRHFGGDDMISGCGSGDIFNMAQEVIWVWGTYRDDFKTPRNHRGALFCGVPKASRRCG
jgi:hypothetical protein